MEQQSKTNRVRTVETTIEIVNALADLERAPLNELADRLDLAPSTVHRHLKTLHDHNYITKEGNEYQLGFQFLTIAGIVRNTKTEYKLAETYVETLANKTKERAQFVIEENDERVFVTRKIGENAVRGDANIGKRGSLHCSAAGKAILAEFPDSRIDRIIEERGLDRFTANTITDPDMLFDELENIRDQGYALNREESAEGFHAVGVSVTDPQDKVVGALSVSGPAHRLNASKLDQEIPELVMGIAQEFELKIEYP